MAGTGPSAHLAPAAATFDVSSTPGRPVAVIAGRGMLPPLVAAAAARQGRAPVILAIAGEADPLAFRPWPTHVLRWGEIGRMFRIVGEAGCTQAVFIGGVARRPELKSIRPDMGGLKLIPRAVRLLRAGDDALLSGIAAFFEENGLQLVSPLEIAPELTLDVGLMAGSATGELLDDVANAAEAARLLGRLDIGQGAVAVHGRVVALEDVGGTDALLERVAALKRDGRIARSGGVLVKCMKPSQDSRIDLPTIGPETAERARAAGLDGVAAEAGRSLLAGRPETLEAFRRAGLFLLGLAPPPAGNE